MNFYKGNLTYKQVENLIKETSRKLNEDNFNKKRVENLIKITLLICHSGLGTENIVSQRIQTNMHKIGKMVIQWK